MICSGREGECENYGKGDTFFCEEGKGNTLLEYCHTFPSCSSDKEHCESEDVRMVRSSSLRQGLWSFDFIN
jgi:hypothetical protein